MNNLMQKMTLRHIVFAVLFGTAIFADDPEDVRNKRQTETCGNPTRGTGMIVFGTPFRRGDFPWIVALTYLPTSPPSFFCGGTLVSPTLVITAAHCIKPKYGESGIIEITAKDILALFGAYNLTNCAESGKIPLTPEKVIVHEDWNPNVERYDADIAALNFERNSIPVTRYIQPICLWTEETDLEDMEGIVAGWGRSEDETKFYEPTPKQVKLPMHSNVDCFLETPSLAELSSKRTFCAGLKNGSGVCLGDSGNGFFVLKRNLFYLRGIVSASRTTATSCDVSKYAIYTNVLEFKPWIHSVLNDGKLACKVGASRFSEDTEIHDSICIIENQAIEKPGMKIQSQNDDSVENLYIEDNRQVKYIPINIAESFPNLVEVHITECSVLMVSDNHFTDLKELNELHLEDNKIATIHVNAFKDLEELKILNLKENNIVTLDENVFSTLENLEELMIQNNQIENLQESLFFKLVGLKTLDFSDNLLADLPSNLFQKNKKLEKLALSDNNITIIPESIFMNLSELDELDLSSNKIATFGASTFKSNRKLRSLRLIHNQLEVFAPNILFSNRNIEILKLDYNRIQHLYKSMLKNMRKLREISISVNRIVEIPDNFFEKNDKLESVTLNNNRIRIIGTNLFKNFDAMESIDLQENICIDKYYSEPEEFEDFAKDVSEQCRRHDPKYVSPGNF